MAIFLCNFYSTIFHNMNKKIFLTLIAVVAAINASAQGRLDLRINEIMVQNTNNYVDQYGNHSAWIEIFNASTSSNNIEQMYITTLSRDEIKDVFDKEKGTSKKGIQIMTDFSKADGKGKLYVIPSGDGETKMKPRSHVVFFADGNDAAGTFHLPFTLNPGDYVALYDVNGKLVDEVTIPANLPANQSFARKSEEGINLHVDHKNPTDDDFTKAESLQVDTLWQVRDGSSDKAITPGKFNARPVNENIQKFKNEDPSGILLTLMSMGVVFSALLLLFILFKLFGKLFSSKDKKKEEVVEKVIDDEVTASQETDNDEAIAAICMALYQHLNAHDEESGILTFDRSRGQNNAWGSKSNLLLHMPERSNKH